MLGHLSFLGGSNVPTIACNIYSGIHSRFHHPISQPNPPFKMRGKLERLERTTQNQLSIPRFTFRSGLKLFSWWMFQLLKFSVTNLLEASVVLECRHELSFLLQELFLRNAQIYNTLRIVPSGSGSSLIMSFIYVPGFASIMFTTLSAICGFLVLSERYESFLRFAAGEISPLEASNTFFVHKWHSLLCLPLWLSH